MPEYTCNKCARTLKYDASWQKTAPKKCGRCTRIDHERFMISMEVAKVFLQMKSEEFE